MNQLLIVAALILIANLSFSQTVKSILESNSKQLYIRDNNVLEEKPWIIATAKKPNIYLTFHKNQVVTFYSDIDSISFFIKPNETILFNVVIDETDTVFFQVVYQRPYIEVLRSAANYDIEKKNKDFKFKYQSKNNRHLKSLRKKYNLDSIAGNGDEISQLINLMNWLHNKVEHNGLKGNPKKKNAESLLSICEKENRSLNCRGLAIVYNECCLSLGFKSRYVTCLPKDSLKIDDDCHVINSVFVKELDKWIWIDPTFNAYVMDEKDNLLSIQEVRTRLIENQPLKINSDANWNNVNKTEIEEYLYNYMAKNLYILECFLESKYNIENNVIIKALTNRLNVVKLVPADYGNYYSDFVNKVSSNPEKFWAKP